MTALAIHNVFLFAAMMTVLFSAGAVAVTVIADCGEDTAHRLSIIGFQFIGLALLTGRSVPGFQPVVWPLQRMFLPAWSMPLIVILAIVAWIRKETTVSVIAGAILAAEIVLAPTLATYLPS